MRQRRRFEVLALKEKGPEGPFYISIFDSKAVHLKPPLLLAVAVVAALTAAKARAEEMNAVRLSMVGSFG
jgi:xanthine dehydrogenase molybdopterin-binding subunit B